MKQVAYALLGRKSLTEFSGASSEVHIENERDLRQVRLEPLSFELVEISFKDEVFFVRGLEAIVVSGAITALVQLGIWVWRDQQVVSDMVGPRTDRPSMQRKLSLMACANRSRRGYRHATAALLAGISRSTLALWFDRPDTVEATDCFDVHTGCSVVLGHHRSFRRRENHSPPRCRCSRSVATAVGESGTSRDRTLLGEPTWFFHAVRRTKPSRF